MKRHSIHSANCSCTSCVYRSRSKQPSVQHLIEEGSRIDKLFYGKYLPLRERKLLEKLIRTRAIYDDVRTQLISTSGSSDQARSDHKIKKRDDDSTEKSSAVLKLVDLVDRGQVSSPKTSKLSSCCSCCSCSSLRKIKKRMEKHPPRVHRHNVPYEEIARYTVEAEKKGRRRRRKLSTKMSSKLQSVQSKMKKIQSEPTLSLSSAIKRSSKALVKKGRSKEHAIANAQKEVIDERKPLTKKICSCSCKIAKLSIKSINKIKSIRKSTTKSSGTDMGNQKAFKIKKDSLTLFREKLEKKRAFKDDLACEPGICVVDECIPEECLKKKLKAKGVGEKRRVKYHNRISGMRIDNRTSTSTKSKNVKRVDSKVQTTPASTFGSVICDCKTTTKSTSSMTSFPQTKSLVKTKSTAKAQYNLKETIIEEKTPPTKSTHSMTGPKMETKKKGPIAPKHHSQFEVKGNTKQEKPIKPERNAPKHAEFHGKERKQAIPISKLRKPATKSTHSMTTLLKSQALQAVQKSETKLKKQMTPKQRPHREMKAYNKTDRNTDLQELKPSTKSTSSMTTVRKVKGKKPIKPKPPKVVKEVVKEEKSYKTDQRKPNEIKQLKSQDIQMVQASPKSKLGNVICECKTTTKSTSSMTSASGRSKTKMKDKAVKQYKGHRPDHYKPKRKPARQTSKQHDKTALQFPRECEPYMCIPYECDPENCARILLSRSKFKGRNVMASTDRFRRKSVGSTASSPKTSSKSGNIQSKGDEILDNNAAERKKRTPPQEVTKDLESVQPQKQAVKISSSFNFNIEFYKQSPDIKSNDVKQVDYVPKNKKTKQTSHRKKYKERGHTARSINSRNFSSQSRSSQSFKNIQVGHKLKRCFCTLKMRKGGSIKENKYNKPKTTGAQQLKVRTQDKANTARDKRKDKSAFAGSAIKRCFCTLKFHKSGKDAKEKKEKDVMSRSTSTQISKPAEDFKRREIKHLHNRQINTDRKKRKSVLSTANTELKVSSKTGRTQSRQLTPPLKKEQKYRTMQGDMRSARSFSPSRQAVRIGSNFSFSVEFFKDHSATSIKKIHKLRPEEYSYSNSYSSTIKKAKNRGTKGERLVSKNRLSQAIIKKEDKASNVGYLLKRCFCTLGLQKKNHKVPQEFRNHPPVTVQVMQVDRNKKNKCNFVLPYVNRREELNNVNSHNMIQSRYSNFKKTLYKKECLTNKPEKNNYPYRENIYYINRNNNKDRIPHSLYNNHQVVNSVIRAKEATPFYQSFYALNVKVSKLKNASGDTHGLGDHVREPYECKPGKCLKNKNYYIKTTDKSGPDYKNKTMGTINMFKSKRVTIEGHDSNRGNLSHKDNSSNYKNRQNLVSFCQALPVRSNISSSVGFYTSTNSETDNDHETTTTSNNLKAKSLLAKCLYPIKKLTETYFNIPKYNQSSSYSSFERSRGRLFYKKRLRFVSDSSLATVVRGAPHPGGDNALMTLSSETRTGKDREHGDFAYTDSQINHRHKKKAESRVTKCLCPLEQNIETRYAICSHKALRVESNLSVGIEYKKTAHRKRDSNILNQNDEHQHKTKRILKKCLCPVKKLTETHFKQYKQRLSQYNSNPSTCKTICLDKKSTSGISQLISKYFFARIKKTKGSEFIHTDKAVKGKDIKKSEKKSSKRKARAHDLGTMMAHLQDKSTSSCAKNCKNIKTKSEYKPIKYSSKAKFLDSQLKRPQENSQSFDSNTSFNVEFIRNRSHNNHSLSSIFDQPKPRIQFTYPTRVSPVYYSKIEKTGYNRQQTERPEIHDRSSGKKKKKEIKSILKPYICGPDTCVPDIPNTKKRSKTTKVKRGKKPPTSIKSDVMDRGTTTKSKRLTKSFDQCHPLCKNKKNQPEVGKKGKKDKKSANKTCLCETSGEQSTVSQKKQSDLNKFIQKCVCSLKRFKGGKELTAKPSTERIGDCNPKCKWYKKNKKVGDMETILPYSKKKYKKHDSESIILDEASNTIDTCTCAQNSKSKKAKSSRNRCLCSPEHNNQDKNGLHLQLGPGNAGDQLPLCPLCMAKLNNLKTSTKTKQVNNYTKTINGKKIAYNKYGEIRYDVCACCKATCPSENKPIRSGCANQDGHEKECDGICDDDDKPLFSMFVNKKMMNVMNKKEMIANLDPNSLESLSRPTQCKEGTVCINLDKDPMPLELTIHKNSAHIMNAKEIVKKIKRKEKKVKKEKKKFTKKKKKEARKQQKAREKELKAKEKEQKAREKKENGTVKGTNGTNKCVVRPLKKVPVDPFKCERRPRTHDEQCKCCCCQKKKAKPKKAPIVCEPEPQVCEPQGPAGDTQGPAGDKQTAQKSLIKFSPLRRTLKPCICGSIICKKNWEQLAKEESSIKHMKKVKPCVCGTDICAAESQKMPELRLKEARRQENLKFKLRKAIKDEKRYQKERLKRKKLYAKQDRALYKQRRKEDRADMKKLKKYAHAPDALMVAESLVDVGKFGVKAVCDLARTSCRYIKHPRDAVHNAKDAYKHPGRFSKEVKETCKGMGFFSTMARVRRRAINMRLTKKVIHKLESYPVTNFIIHMADKDPRKRMKKFNEKRKREPLDFECSLFMASLRKRPCLSVYYSCPWFYPHCVSLLSLWKQFTDVILFILAVGVWSPCIFCMEFCRALMCCCLCTQ